MGNQRVKTKPIARATTSASRTPTRGARLPNGKRSVADTPVALADDAGNYHNFSLRPAVDTFLYVTVERHRIFERRVAGEPAPWSDDEIFQRHHFTNVFRVLDRNTQYVLSVVIREGSNKHREQVFRVLLFRLFDRIETYEYLRKQFGVPSWEQFDRQAWSRALADKLESDDKSRVFGAAYQKHPPTEDKIGGKDAHERALRLLELLMSTGFAEEIEECKELCDIHIIIARYPTLGHFLGYQFILDLNMIPSLVLAEDFTVTGPGSQNGLALIFGAPLPDDLIGRALSWLDTNLSRLFADAGYAKEIPALVPGKPGLSIVDVEHILCEFSKYVKLKAAGKSGKSGGRKFTSSNGVRIPTRALPKDWQPVKRAYAAKRGLYTNLPPVENGQYWVRAVIDKDKVGRVTMYKVRWWGWAPEADTWETREVLLQDAPDRVREYEEKCARIEEKIRDFFLEDMDRDMGMDV